MRVVSINIKNEQLEMLDTFVIKNRMNRSAAIRKAIILFLQPETNKDAIPDDSYIRGESRVITFKIEDELLKELDTYVINHKISRSEVIRKAIQLWIQKQHEKEIVPKAKVEKFNLNKNFPG